MSGSLSHYPHPEFCCQVPDQAQRPLPEPVSATTSCSKARAIFLFGRVHCKCGTTVACLLHVLRQGRCEFLSLAVEDARLPLIMDRLVPRRLSTISTCMCDPLHPFLPWVAYCLSACSACSASTQISEHSVDTPLKVWQRLPNTEQHGLRTLSWALKQKLHRCCVCPCPAPWSCRCRCWARWDRIQTRD